MVEINEGNTYTILVCNSVCFFGSSIIGSTFIQHIKHYAYTIYIYIVILFLTRLDSFEGLYDSFLSSTRATVLHTGQKEVP